MYCKHCGHKCKDQALFCAGCGVSLKPPAQPPGEPPADSPPPASPYVQSPAPPPPVAPPQPGNFSFSPQQVNQAYGHGFQTPPSAPQRQEPPKTPIAKIAVILVLVLALSAGGFFAWRYFSPDSASLEQSFTHYAANRYNLALEGFRAAVDSGNRDPRTLEALADCCLRTGDEGGAVKALELLMEADPTENTLKTLTALKESLNRQEGASNPAVSSSRPESSREPSAPASSFPAVSVPAVSSQPEPEPEPEPFSNITDSMLAYYRSYLSAINTQDAFAIESCTGRQWEFASERVANPLNSTNIFRFSYIEIDMDTVEYFLSDDGFSGIRMRIALRYDYTPRTGSEGWSEGGNIQWCEFVESDLGWVCDFTEIKDSEVLGDNLMSIS